MEKVVLGLSGGVDSAVAARRLQQQGFEVFGVYLDAGCQSSEDAVRAARELEIPLEIVPIGAMLEKEVIGPFVQGYLSGKTPIPCILCNPAVKFKVLFGRAEKLGAAYVATGHYAQVKPVGGGITGLFQSPSSNDQSYMLYRLPQEWLSRMILPLGGVNQKEETRHQAADSGLSVAEKPDSMEICFIPDGDYASFIEKHCAAVPPAGDFVDENGKVLGRHLGIHHYTVGQRRGLGVSAASRLFVKAIDVEHNRVVLSDEDPYAEEIFIHSVCATAPEFGAEPFEADVKIRHSRRTDRAVVEYLAGGRAKITFLKPARAPSPGQSAVFYREGRVIGGGYIEKP